MLRIREAFLATIKRYNELCGKGKDEDFGKDAKWMNAIQTPPFYGVRRHLRVSAICSGVYINANGQALDADRQPMEGLYCVGNLGGQFYGGADYPLHSPACLSAAAIPSGGWRQSTPPHCPAVQAPSRNPGTTALAASAAATSGSWKDGTYQGTGKGVYGDDINVTVTVSGGKITAVTVDKQSETADIGAAALPKYVDEIIANQSVEIDAVTGATRTKEGFAAAVSNALSKAAS